MGGDGWPLVGRVAELERVASAIARGDCSGVVLIGQGGVGKTRIATECRSLAEAAGYSTEVAVATHSTSTITLGALAPLLPDLGDRTINLLGAARDALAARAGNQPLMLVIDDGHLLDDVSAALLLQIAADKHTFVVVTVRSGEEVSDALTALWKDGHAERIDVEPLPDADTDQLTVEALGGPVDVRAQAELLRLSAGNPLALRELIVAAREAGTLALVGDEWRLTGPIAVSPRLHDLVAHRLAGLDDVALAALEIVALGEPIGVGIVEGLSSPSAVESLERHGLVRVLEDQRRLEVWVAHPLYGEIVRDGIGRLRRRSILRSLADAVEARGSGRRGDLLRVATWRLESGTATNVGLLTAAARQAFVAVDMELARRLAQAAWDVEPSFTAGHLLGHVSADLGRREDAEAVLSVVTELAATDDQRVLVAMARSENLFRWDRPDEALRVVEAAEAVVVDPEWRLELTGHRATFVMLLGRVHEALDLVAPALAGDAARPLIEGAIAAGTALTFDGRVDDALAVLERAYAVHLDIWEHELFQSDPGVHVVGIVSALMNAGRLDESEQLLDIGWAAATEQNATHGLAWFALLRGMVLTMRGQMASALNWNVRSASLFGQASLKGREQWPVGGALLAAASLNRRDAAHRLEERLDAIDTCVRFNHVLLDEARAWCWATRGEFDRARDLLDHAADEGISEGSRATASAALHSLARLGAPERAVERSEMLAAECQGELINARSAHVAALAKHDAAALSVAAATFATMGLLLVAGEAEADAARAYRKAGRSRDASAAAQRSRGHVLQCEGALTPALALVDEATPLTRREREVAMLASQGQASKDIAETLFLSVRTVENHLQRAYEKLGVTGREELASVMGT